MAGSLGRVEEFDPRSRMFGVVAGSSTILPPVKVWERRSAILDQGHLGSCTGHAMGAWLGCSPFWDTVLAPVGGRMAQAVRLYSLATTLDRYPGSYPPDDTGSSGLAVAKAAKKLGYIKAYSWAFTVSGMLAALQLAPVIVGVPWYGGFDHPDSTGTVTPTGVVRGGHEFCIRGYDTGYFVADNSWGPTWGLAGSFRFSFDSWEFLRKQGADVVCPHVPPPVVP